MLWKEIQEYRLLPPTTIKIIAFQRLQSKIWIDWQDHNQGQRKSIEHKLDFLQ